MFNTGKKYRVLVSSSIAAITCGLGVSNAQPAFEEGDAIFVTGSRGQPRALKDSAVPIDIIGADELENVSFTDTNEIIQTLVPSFTVPRTGGDGANFIRQSALRGLPTDKTLILVNSKRRHRAALVPTGGSGSQGPDLSTIPGSAIKTVEVLRDGAAAQYGSDAIAGVMNFILKDNSSGFSATSQIGQFYEGDGTEYMASANAGFDLFGKGFFSVSAEYYEADATVRAEQVCENSVCVDINDPRYLSGSRFDTTVTGYSDASFEAGLPLANIGQGDVVLPRGRPNVKRIGAFYNMGYDLGNATEFYSFGNYTFSESDGTFFYRYPGNGVIEDYRLEDGSLWSPLLWYPGGFTPRFSGEVQDISLVGGLRGETPGGLTWDVSGRLGKNTIFYTLLNTLNPSLGPDSPRNFRPGDLVNEEIQFQADLTKEYDLDMFESPLLMAFGLSYMEESYELVEGDVPSYETGPFALQDPFGFCDGTPGMGATLTANGLAVNATLDPMDQIDCNNADDPLYRASLVGANGFPGYSPEFTGLYTRESIAAYVDFSADITSKWFLQAAGRIENYSDFGTEIIGKVATQFDVADSLSLRGSVSTGFRAPTPGQQGTTSVSTRLPNGFPVATGLFPPSSAVSAALGAEPLQPETSVNFTAGLVGDLFGIDYTIDFYRIEIEDRTYATSAVDVSTDPTAGAAYDNFLALEAAGVAGANSIGAVFFFANAFDTVTQGVDIVLTKDVDWGKIGATDFLVSFNYNQSEFDGDLTNLGDFLNPEDQFDFENELPDYRTVLQATHRAGDFGLLARANIYGPYEEAGSAGAAGPIQEFSETVQVDLEASYDLSDNYTVAIGARNIFDSYPDEGDDIIGDTTFGAIYRGDSIVPWQGGYYYARLLMNF